MYSHIYLYYLYVRYQMTLVANLSQVPVAYDNTCLSYTLHIFQFLLSQRPATTTKKVQQKMETIANTE